MRLPNNLCTYSASAFTAHFAWLKYVKISSVICWNLVSKTCLWNSIDNIGTYDISMMFVSLTFVFGVFT